jgi:hypothetical protein
MLVLSLELLPGPDHDNVIECVVREYSLETRPSYTSMSYTWGPPQDPGHSKSIQLNSRRFPVRDSLWPLLYHLKSTNTMQTLRIDTI